MKNRISQLRDQADGDYSNYNGNRGRIPMYDYYGGTRYKGALSELYSPFNGAVAAGADKLSEIDRTLQVTVANASSLTVSDVRLFNSFDDLTDANLSSDITITIPESSHTFVKAEIMSNPYQIFGCLFVVQNETQLDNTWTLRRQNATASDYRNSWFPRARQSAQNDRSNQVDMMDFVYWINGKNSIQLDINGNETVVFTFFIKTKVQIENLGKGLPPVKTNELPPPTGISPVDIQTYWGRGGAL